MGGRRLRVAVLASVLLLVSCSKVESIEVSLEGVEWTLFRLEGRGGFAEGGGVEGEVHFELRDGCVYLRNVDSLLPTVWPAGTTFAAAGRALVLADGRILEDGQVIDGETNRTARGTGSARLRCPGTDGGYVVVVDYVDPDYVDPDSGPLPAATTVPRP